MPIRLTAPYEGQAANTLYFGSAAIEAALRATGGADDQIELASDYQQLSRTSTIAATAVVRTANVYLMNSGSAQALTLNATGWLPLGAVITVVQLGAGAVTVTPGTGVTISTKLSSLITGGQYSIGQLLKTGPNTWLAFGGFGG